MQRGGLSQVTIPVLVSSSGFLLFTVVDAAAAQGTQISSQRLVSSV